DPHANAAPAPAFYSPDGADAQQQLLASVQAALAASRGEPAATGAAAPTAAGGLPADEALKLIEPRDWSLVAGQTLLSRLLSRAALSEVEALARQPGGDGAALFGVGLAHDLGVGMPKDEPGAARYYQEAATRGFARAQAALGMIKLNGDNGVAKDEAAGVR